MCYANYEYLVFFVVAIFEPNPTAQPLKNSVQQYSAKNEKISGKGDEKCICENRIFGDDDR